MVVLKLCLLCGQFKGDPGPKQKELYIKARLEKQRNEAQIHTMTCFRIGGRLTRS